MDFIQHIIWQNVTTNRQKYYFYQFCNRQFYSQITQKRLRFFVYYFCHKCVRHRFNRFFFVYTQQYYKRVFLQIISVFFCFLLNSLEKLEYISN